MTGLEVKIISEFDNVLLNRKEYLLEVLHPGSSTPSRKEVRAEIAKIFNVPLNRVIVRKISSRYGTNKAIVRVHIYKSEEAVKIEPKYILRRNFGGEE